MSGVLSKCPHCKKVYKTDRNLRKHLLTHDVSGVGGSQNPGTEGTDIVLYSCEQCGKKYKTQQGLKKHQSIHAQPGVVTLDSVRSGDDTDTYANNVVTAAGHSIGEKTADHAADQDLWPEEAVLLNASRNVQEVISFFEEEDEEQERLLLATLIGVETNNAGPALAQQKEQQQGKQNQKSKVKSKPLVICKVCKSALQTLDGYTRHKMTHAMNAAVAKAPPLEQVKEAASGLCKDVADMLFSDNIHAKTKLEMQLQELACKMKEFHKSDKLQTFLDSLCKYLYACLENGAKFPLPSHLRLAFLKGVSQVLVSVEARQKLCGEMKDALELRDVEVNFFLVSFIRKFASKVLVYIMHWMVHDSPVTQNAFAVTKQSTDSVEFKELMCFIGGANIKSVLRSAWRSWGTNDECKLVIKTIRENFLLNAAGDNAPDAEFMEWTNMQDKGKLIKVNSGALNFFVELAIIVKPLEHFDGSLIINEVLDSVSNHLKILYVWENLVEDALPKKTSFKLLFSIVEYFCRTWGSGIVRRRMDELQGLSNVSEPLGTSGVAFRPKVVNFTK